MHSKEQKLLYYNLSEGAQVYMNINASGTDMFCTPEIKNNAKLSTILQRYLLNSLPLRPLGSGTLLKLVRATFPLACPTAIS